MIQTESVAHLMPRQIVGRITVVGPIVRIPVDVGEIRLMVILVAVTHWEARSGPAVNPRLSSPLSRPQIGLVMDDVRPQG